MMPQVVKGCRSTEQPCGARLFGGREGEGGLTTARLALCMMWLSQGAVRLPNLKPCEYYKKNIKAMSEDAQLGF